MPLLSCNQRADIDSSESRVEGIPTSSEFLPGYGLREPAGTVFAKMRFGSRPLGARPATPFSLLVVLLQQSDMLIRA